jgi:hypothetical protein
MKCDICGREMILKQEGYFECDVCRWNNIYVKNGVITVEPITTSNGFHKEPILYG